jgi:hypothetical protein
MLVIKALSDYFVVKDLGEMKVFTVCDIITNDAKDTVYIHQPKLILHLKEQFGSLVESLKEYPTPASPRSIVKRPKKEDIFISVEMQIKFRSGVGMLLYMVKHSRFDISNAVRELSKVADGASKSTQMHQVCDHNRISGSQIKTKYYRIILQNGWYF